MSAISRGTTLFQIENLVGLLKLRETGTRVGALAEFDKFDDVTLAKMLASLSASYMAEVIEDQP